MERNLLVHAIAFVYLCGVVSLILSCYREESLPRILRESARRTAKFALFIAILAFLAWGYGRLQIDS